MGVAFELIDLAKSLVGKANWKYEADFKDAPNFFDCSSLTKWLFAQEGIIIPRYAYQQFLYCSNSGKEITRINDVRLGDLIFTTSPYWKGIYSSQQREFGHVCIVSRYGEIICATDSEFGKGIVNIRFSQLFVTRKFCGAGRIL